MSSVLKGNYETKAKIEAENEKKKDGETLEDRFEREAMKRLGGSIAYVAKRKVVWDMKD